MMKSEEPFPEVKVVRKAAKNPYLSQRLRAQGQRFGHVDAQGRVLLVGSDGSWPR